MSTTYGIIRWNPGFDRAKFATAKAQGLQQTSFDTVRKKLDGTEAVISWDSQAAPAVVQANLLWSGTLAECFARIGNDPAWTKLPTDALTTRKLSKTFWRVAAAVASAAASGSLVYFLLS
jgi:hypothetical protein